MFSAKLMREIMRWLAATMAGNSDDANGKGKVIKTALEPMAKEFADASKGSGKAMGNVVHIGAKTVEAVFKIVLGPLVWGYVQIEEWLALDVEKELESVPPERRIEPRLSVAGPAVQAMVFLGHESELRAMFAKLLATSMDAETAHLAHPAFVEIIKQLSPDEARLLRYLRKRVTVPMIDIRVHDKDNKYGTEFHTAFRNLTTLGEDAKCEVKGLLPVYIDNLIRLKLCDSPPDAELASSSRYESLEQDPDVQGKMQNIHEVIGDTKTAKISRRLLEMTDFGNQFASACIRLE